MASRSSVPIQRSYCQGCTMSCEFPFSVSAPLRVACTYCPTVSFRPVAGSGVRFRDTTLWPGSSGITTPPDR